jgi:hypothetical protein
MADQPYYYDSPHLQLIINQTNVAIDELDRLNGMVQSNSDALGDANKSDSGRIMTQHLAEWTTDFGVCRSNLKDLNDKAQHLLSINQNTDANSTGQAK